MSGQLDHNPGEVIQQLLVDMVLATLPASAGAWPVYYSWMPDDTGVDGDIGVYDSTGVPHGRTQFDGIQQLHYGFQVIIRNTDIALARTKIRAMADGFDEDVLRRTVTVDSTNYAVQSIERQGDVMFMGREGGTSRRRRFSINALTAIDKIV